MDSCARRSCATLLFTVVLPWAFTSASRPQTCRVREHEGVTANVTETNSSRWIKYTSGSQQDCIRECCSKGVSCNMAVHKSPETLHSPNCWLLRCEKVNECPLTLSPGATTFTASYGPTEPDGGKTTAEPSGSVRVATASASTAEPTSSSRTRAPPGVSSASGILASAAKALTFGTIVRTAEVTSGAEGTATARQLPAEIAPSARQQSNATRSMDVGAVEATRVATTARVAAGKPPPPGAAAKPSRSRTPSTAAGVNRKTTGPVRKAATAAAERTNGPRKRPTATSATGQSESRGAGTSASAGTASNLPRAGAVGAAGVTDAPPADGGSGTAAALLLVGLVLLALAATYLGKKAAESSHPKGYTKLELNELY